MSKRAFLDFASGSDPNLTILTHDGRIPAHSDVLRLVCSCLKNAPSADTWDLQQLLVDGKPVASDTVVTVLEYIYGNMGAMDVAFDETPGRLSIMQLRDMLLFADAIGCSKRILQGMAGMLGVCVRLQLEVVLPGNAVSTSSRRSGSSSGSRARAAKAAAEAAEQSVVLELDGVYTMHEDEDEENGVEKHAMLQSWSNNLDTEIIKLGIEQGQQFRQAVAEQMESLLHTAFKLDVGPLLSCMLLFVRNNTVFTEGILGKQSNVNIFSPRVLSVAGCSMGGELLSRACMQLPLGQGLGIDTVFDVADRSITSSGFKVMFEATLLKDLYEFSKGSAVSVIIDINHGNLQLALMPDGVDDGVEPGYAEYFFSTVLGHSDSFPNP